MVIPGLGWPTTGQPDDDERAGRVGRSRTGLGWPADVDESTSSERPASADAGGHDEWRDRENQQAGNGTGTDAGADAIFQTGGSVDSPEEDDAVNATEGVPAAVPVDEQGTGFQPAVPRETAIPTAGFVEGDGVIRFPNPITPPPNTRTLVIANQKGGVGKTTTAVNLAAALAALGARVLVIDLDPQGNASTAFDIEHHEGTPSIYETIIDGQPLSEILHPVRRFPSLWAVPATIDLSGAELELVSVIARESRLKRALEAHCAEREAAGERYDYVFIDCPPSLGLLTINAMVAAKEVLVPIQCEFYALEGVTALFRTIAGVQAQLNPDLSVSSVLLTMYDGRTRLSAQVAEEVRDKLGDAVLRTAVPRSVRISEAPSFQQTVITWDPNSPGALSYIDAARELAERDPAAQTG